jgi:hypothetical protein
LNILASTRGGKRWNGSTDTLPATFLTGVLAKMADYGDSVQFSLISGGSEPAYQVTNAFGKAMAFDRNHHIMQAEAEDYVGLNASTVLSIDQIKAAIAGISISGKGARKGPAVKRAAGVPRTTAAMIEEQHSAQRYAYFKENRDMLPAGISKYSNEIADLMKKGKTVEQAFDEIGAKYF